MITFHYPVTEEIISEFPLSFLIEEFLSVLKAKMYICS